MMYQRIAMGDIAIPKRIPTGFGGALPSASGRDEMIRWPKHHPLKKS